MTKADLPASDEVKLPASAASQFVSLCASVALVASVCALWNYGYSARDNALHSTLAFLVVLVLLELFVRRIYRRPSAGLEVGWPRLWAQSNATRAGTKLLGFAATVGVLWVLYDTFPLYEQQFFATWNDVLGRVAPWTLLIIVPYIWVVDAWMVEPRDGYFEMGQLVLLRWRGRDWPVLEQHALGWLIKGIFLPIMWPFMVDIIDSFTITLEYFPTDDPSILASVQLVDQLAFMLDMAFVVVGYTMTCRLTDSHIRSTNPLFWGWIVCLMWYQPFHSLFGREYLNYNDGQTWHFWLAEVPWLFRTWGVLVIASKLFWLWANFSFGLRFSNLTHRGILTNGPYRWMKHPSYFSKNLSWWLVSMPFLSTAGAWVAFQHSLLLLMVNAGYALRAISEERHLAEDPVYAAYAAWIGRHGLVARLRRLTGWSGVMRARHPGTNRAERRRRHPSPESPPGQ